jgi:hypothetical protein
MHRIKKFYESLGRGERRLLAAAFFGIIVGIIGFGTSWYVTSTRSVPAEGGAFREGIVGQPAYVNRSWRKAPPTAL